MMIGVKLPFANNLSHKITQKAAFRQFWERSY